MQGINPVGATHTHMTLESMFRRLVHCARFAVTARPTAFGAGTPNVGAPGPGVSSQTSPGALCRRPLAWAL